MSRCKSNDFITRSNFIVLQTVSNPYVDYLYCVYVWAIQYISCNTNKIIIISSFIYLFHFRPSTLFHKSFLPHTSRSHQAPVKNPRTFFLIPRAYSFCFNFSLHYFFLFWFHTQNKLAANHQLWIYVKYLQTELLTE